MFADPSRGRYDGPYMRPANVRETMCILSLVGTFTVHIGYGHQLENQLDGKTQKLLVENCIHINSNILLNLV